MKQISVILSALLFSLSLHAEVRIAVVGVHEDMNLIERWASAENSSISETASAKTFRVDDLNTVVVAPRPTASLAEVASLLYQANAAVIVIDTTQGPLPINREQIILARQARVPVISIMLANVDDLHTLAPKDAAELLMLEEEEVRYLMSAYELDGPSALLFHDANAGNNAPTGSSGGLNRAMSMLAGVANGDNRHPPAELRQMARGQVYLLTEAEVYGAPLSISGSASMEIWSEGHGAVVDVTSATAAGPGDVAEVSIRAQGEFRGDAGSRFVLINDESLVGIGVLTEVNR